MKKELFRIKILINGIVQGVGFRPFIYRIALEHNLKGFVRNTGNGVIVELEGKKESINNFLSDLNSNKVPTIAKIESIKTEYINDLVGYKEFTIIESDKENKISTYISPDIATCNECLEEMYDSKDRRYKYPFINCTNCGPRYTIIEKLPYDRSYTTMKIFKLCHDCEQEYNNPLDRRFHAQPVACPVCGPSLQLIDKNKNIIQGDPIDNTRNLLKQGKILAIKGIGGFHIALDATNDESVNKLRYMKKRPHKPFAIMSPDIDTVSKYAYLFEKEKEYLNSVYSPILLLKNKNNNLISKLIAPNNAYLGVMLPYTPLHHLILKDFLALVMTSGNISGEPIITDNEYALKKLNNFVDYFLIHDRPIYQPVDDSVIRIVNFGSIFIRRSRGFTPNTIRVKEKFKKSILGCGAHLKSTVSLTKNNHIYVSQYIGDLENIETISNYKRIIKHLQDIFEIKPEIVVSDLHPDYFSTRYAQNTDLKCFKVQHHHAHIASCMIENDLDSEVIGIALDGTGYGTDMNIWGGEVFIVNKYSFKRICHIEYIPLPGGDKSIIEPWRMCLSYLYKYWNKDVKNLNLPILQRISSNKQDIIFQMIDKNINSPLTSSCGRLFDAISALIGLCYEITYEGQAAIELESLVESEEHKIYSFDLIKESDKYIISFKNTFVEIINDLNDKVPLDIISTSFHLTLVELFTRICNIIKNKYDLKKVVLSGGVFQNKFFSEQLVNLLIQNNFKVFTHKQISPNDECISVGQVAIVNSFLK